MMRPVLLSLIAFAALAPSQAEACAMRLEEREKAPLFALMDEIDEAADTAKAVAVDVMADMVTKSTDLRVKVQAPPALVDMPMGQPSQDATADAADEAPQKPMAQAPRTQPAS